MSDSDAADDSAFEDWLDEGDGPHPGARGFVLRHPTLLLGVLLGAAFVGYKSWHQASYLLQSADSYDCGDVAERPQMKLDTPGGLPPLPHDRFCSLRGTVQVLPIFATGGGDADAPRPEAGRKYFLKLAGDNIFAVVAADRQDVRTFRARRGSLFGFYVEGTGRVIDPDTEPGSQATAQVLRLRFSIPDDQPIRLFDTTESPSDYWPNGVVLGLMVLTTLLAGFGLVRIALSRRAAG